MAPTLNAFGNEKKFIPSISDDPEEMFKKMTGTQNKDCSIVVVLRNTGISYAMEDRLWAKYKLGELFKANDSETQAPSVRNPF